MINRLYENIAEGLKEVRNCTVYQEDVPQNFVRPSFMISFYEQSPTHGINTRLHNTVSIDVAFFPKDSAGAKRECWEVGQDLYRSFRIRDFKIRNRNLTIVDNVLHFMFEVSYREYEEDQAQKIQDISHSEKVKEN